MISPQCFVRIFELKKIAENLVEPINELSQIQIVPNKETAKKIVLDIYVKTTSIAVSVGGLNQSNGYFVDLDNKLYKYAITKSDADDLNTFPVIGLAQTAIGDEADGVVVLSGVFTGVSTNSYTAGDTLYVNSGGGLTTTQPASGSGVVGVVSIADTNGIILVGA